MIETGHTIAGARLSGKVAIVSGASRGVGRAYAIALARAGAKVMALARTAEGDPTVPGSLAELEKAARDAGLTVATQGCDVRDEDSIRKVVSRTVELFGGLDVLLNNAVWEISSFNVLEVSPHEWESAFSVNVRAPYAFMREAIPHMRAHGGSIINITSGAANHSTVPGSGAHGYPAYSVTKAALERMTTYFAAEFRDEGIAVNAVSPGHVAYYIRDGRVPDLTFWGEPILHLAEQRPPEGMTGQILHTYQYGRGWGPAPANPPQWDEEIVHILREAGITA